MAYLGSKGRVGGGLREAEKAKEPNGANEEREGKGRREGERAVRPGGGLGGCPLAQCGVCRGWRPELYEGEKCRVVGGGRGDDLARRLQLAGAGGAVRRGSIGHSRPKRACGAERLGTSEPVRAAEVGDVQPAVAVA